MAGSISRQDVTLAKRYVAFRAERWARGAGFQPGQLEIWGVLYNGKRLD